MTIYREKSFTFAEFKEYIAMIESALLQNIAKHFELPSWEKMIKEYFLLRRFAEEEQRTVVAANEKDVPASYVIFKQIQKLTGIHREKFVFLIQETMNESRDYLEGKLSEMTQLQSFIREYIEGNYLFHDHIAKNSGGRVEEWHNQKKSEYMKYFNRSRKNTI